MDVSFYDIDVNVDFFFSGDDDAAFDLSFLKDSFLDLMLVISQSYQLISSWIQESRLERTRLKRKPQVI